jgi:hypothetical protein
MPVVIGPLPIPITSIGYIRNLLIGLRHNLAYLPGLVNTLVNFLPQQFNRLLFAIIKGNGLFYGRLDGKGSADAGFPRRWIEKDLTVPRYSHP